MHLLKHVPKSTRHLNTEVHLNRGVKSQELLPWKHTEESECFERDTFTPRTLLRIPWGNTDFQTGTGPDAFRLGLVHVEFWQTCYKAKVTSTSHILQADFGSPSRPNWASRCQKWVVIFHTVWETSSGPPSLSPGVAPTAYIKLHCNLDYICVCNWRNHWNSYMWLL